MISPALILLPTEMTPLRFVASIVLKLQLAKLNLFTRNCLDTALLIERVAFTKGAIHYLGSIQSHSNGTSLVPTASTSFQNRSPYSVRSSLSTLSSIVAFRLKAGMLDRVTFK